MDFEFDGQGLVLVAGPTGAGKSTLCDVIPWVLFGHTAKGGAVDEVLSWPGNEITTGTIYFDDGLEITRIRGAKAKDNDLFFLYENDTGTVSAQRGKDIADTQKLINDFIGVDFNLYLSGAYFHEFSQTAQFFTATAKTRRQITEQIVDLTLAKNLTEKIKEYAKETKKEHEKLSSDLKFLQYKEQTIKDTIKAETDRSVRWEKARETKLTSLRLAQANYERDKTKSLEKELLKYYELEGILEQSLEDLNTSMVPANDIEQRKEKLKESSSKNIKIVCPQCGNVKNQEYELLIVKEEYAISTLEAQNEQKKIQYIQQLNSLAKYKTTLLEIQNRFARQENTHTASIEVVSTEPNPHSDSISKSTKELSDLAHSKILLESSVMDFQSESDDLELLLTVMDDFRSVLIKNVVTDLETNVNKIITNYFDAEIRVQFDVADSDKLEVSIFKDGNQAQFTQLSKGQRQLLKLAFGISVMRAVSNHHGLDFNTVFFDEALDGLSEEFKVKSYGLLQSLEKEYSSIFVVEHSESLKALFDNRYDVSLENGNSVIEKS